MPASSFDSPLPRHGRRRVCRLRCDRNRPGVHVRRRSTPQSPRPPARPSLRSCSSVVRPTSTARIRTSPGGLVENPDHGPAAALAHRLDRNHQRGRIAVGDDVEMRRHPDPQPPPLCLVQLVEPHRDVEQRHLVSRCLSRRAVAGTRGSLRRAAPGRKRHRPARLPAGRGGWPLPRPRRWGPEPTGGRRRQWSAMHRLFPHSGPERARLPEWPATGPRRRWAP